MINTECYQVNFTPTQFQLVLSEVSDVPGTQGVLDLTVATGTGSVCGLSTEPYYCAIGSDTGPVIGTLTLNSSLRTLLQVQRVMVVPILRPSTSRARCVRISERVGDCNGRRLRTRTADSVLEVVRPWRSFVR